MPDEDLTPASLDDLIFDISYALRFRRGKSDRVDAEIMARSVTQRIVEHLELANYVVMRSPPRRPHSTPGREGRGP